MYTCPSIHPSIWASCFRDQTSNKRWHSYVCIHHPSELCLGGKKSAFCNYSTRCDIHSESAAEQELLKTKACLLTLNDYLSLKKSEPLRFGGWLGGKRMKIPFSNQCYGAKLRVESLPSRYGESQPRFWMLYIKTALSETQDQYRSTSTFFCIWFDAAEQEDTFLIPHIYVAVGGFQRKL